MPGESSEAGDRSHPVALASRLIELGYLAIFRQSDEIVLQGIWNTPGAPDDLEVVAASSSAPKLARFLAAEILFYQGEVLRVERHKAGLARVYGTALADRFTEVANPWGLPGFVDGLAGEHLLAIGEPMVPELLKLFGNEARVYYEGSQEATLGHHYGYRVKDLAAYFLGKIRNIHVELDEDPYKRDEAIENLKRAVK